MDAERAEGRAGKRTQGRGAGWRLGLAALLLALGGGGGGARAQALPSDPLTGAVAASVFGHWSLTSDTAVPGPGTYTLTLNVSTPPTVPGGASFEPLAVNAALAVGSGAEQEMATPSQVSCLPTSCTIVITLARPHPGRVQVSSGTGGLQEAINEQARAGGIVVLDPDWHGNLAEAQAAQGAGNVILEDPRGGHLSWYLWNGHLYVPELSMNGGAAAGGATSPSPAVALGSLQGVSLGQVRNSQGYNWSAAASTPLGGGALATLTPDWPAPPAGVTSGAHSIVATAAGSALVNWVAAAGSDPFNPDWPAGKPVILDGRAYTIVSCSSAQCTLSAAAFRTTAYGHMVVGFPDSIFLSAGAASALAAPVLGAPQATVETEGGQVGDGTYYYIVTAVDASGDESLASEESEAVAVVGAGGQAEVRLTWPAAASAAHYRIYRGTSGGGENAVQTASGNSFVDKSAGGGTPATPPEVLDILGTGGSECPQGGALSICISPRYPHSGSYHIQSATNGIQEAVNSWEASGGYYEGEVHIAAGTHNSYATVLLSRGELSLAGDGAAASILDNFSAGPGILALNVSNTIVRNLGVSGDNYNSGFDIAFLGTSGAGGPGTDMIDNVQLTGATAPTVDWQGQPVPGAGVYVAAMDGMALENVDAIYNAYGAIVDADGGGGGSGFCDTNQNTAFNSAGGVWMRGTITGACFQGGRIFNNQGPGLVLNAFGGSITGLHIEGNQPSVEVSGGSEGIKISGNNVEQSVDAWPCVICLGSASAPVSDAVLAANALPIQQAMGQSARLISAIDAYCNACRFGPNTIEYFGQGGYPLPNVLTLEAGSSNNSVVAFSLGPNATTAGRTLTVGAWINDPGKGVQVDMPQAYSQAAVLLSPDAVLSGGTISGNLHNSCSGLVQLVAGKASVTNPCIVGTRAIALSEQATVAPNALGYTQTVGQLSIRSASASDTSIVAWAQQ